MKEVVFKSFGTKTPNVKHGPSEPLAERVAEWLAG